MIRRIQRQKLSQLCQYKRIVRTTRWFSNVETRDTCVHVFPQEDDASSYMLTKKMVGGEICLIRQDPRGEVSYSRTLFPQKQVQAAISKYGLRNKGEARRNMRSEIESKKETKKMVDTAKYVEKVDLEEEKSMNKVNKMNKFQQEVQNKIMFQVEEYNEDIEDQETAETTKEIKEKGRLDKAEGKIEESNGNLHEVNNEIMQGECS